jgi:hypothetical protein
VPNTTDGQNDQATPDLGPAVPGPVVRPIPLDELMGLDAGEEWKPDPRDADAVGRTMFDAPGSKDNSLVVLLPRDSLNRVPAQSLLRIESREDDRTYLGIVTAGPFAEPDGLRADAPTIVTTAVRGATAFVPRYHGRVQVEILGERRSGALSPPRYRPLPNSPVFLLDSKESSDVLALGGNLRLGVVAAGDDSLTIDIPADKKSVLPRHTGVLGTTGGGKSTTVSRMIDQAQRQGFAVILLDTEGEYTLMNEPTEDPTMLKLLAERGEEPHGVEKTTLYTLAGKRTSNPNHPLKAEFDLSFERFSPFVVQELLDLSDAQEERFSQAYEAAKTLLRGLGVFPARNNDDEKRVAMELNEFETGYPKMKLDHIIDVVADGPRLHVRRRSGRDRRDDGGLSRSSRSAQGEGRPAGDQDQSQAVMARPAWPSPPAAAAQGLRRVRGAGLRRAARTGSCQHFRPLRFGFPRDQQPGDRRRAPRRPRPTG